MQNIWDTDEEEKKRRMMMGAPLEGIQYQRQDTQQQAPIREQAGPPSVGTTAQNMLIARTMGQGMDYGIKKAGEGIQYGIDQAKDYLHPQGAYAQQDQYLKNLPKEGGTEQQQMLNAQNADMQAPLSAAPVDAGTTAQTMAENTPEGDVISGMPTGEAIPLSIAPLAAAPDAGTTAATMAANTLGEETISGMAGDAASDLTVNAATNVGTEVATQAGTEAVASAATEAGAEAVAEGAAGSLAGPLAGGIELMKSGDVGKAGGKAAGAYAGAVLGSIMGPAGTFVGGVLGSYIGGELGGYLT